MVEIDSVIEKLDALANLCKCFKKTAKSLECSIRYSPNTFNSFPFATACVRLWTLSLA